MENYVEFICLPNQAGLDSQFLANRTQPFGWLTSIKGKETLYNLYIYIYIKHYL